MLRLANHDHLALGRRCGVAPDVCCALLPQSVVVSSIWSTLFDLPQDLVPGLGGACHAGKVVVALGGDDRAVAEQGGDDADLLGGGEGDGGGHGIAEAVRVDGVRERRRGVPGEAEMQVVGADRRALAGES